MARRYDTRLHPSVVVVDVEGALHQGRLQWIDVSALGSPTKRSKAPAEGKPRAADFHIERVTSAQLVVGNPAHLRKLIKQGDRIWGINGLRFRDLKSSASNKVWCMRLRCVREIVGSASTAITLLVSCS